MNKISLIKEEVIKLFPTTTKNREKIYCTSTWIFPNHFNPMINIAKELCDKYGGDKEICEIACLLHDTGLVYERESKNPIGHESKSLKFASNILNKYNFSENKIELVLKCIKATEVDYEPETNEEKIVRTADILSQFYSMHFFAKAYQYETWEMYLNFFEKKISKGFDKICFEDEKDKVKPIRDYYIKILEEYKRYNYST
jgi:HD superfamily phosphodiesterase